MMKQKEFLFLKRSIFCNVFMLAISVSVVASIFIPQPLNEIDTNLLQQANEILTEFPIVDGHNDWPHQFRKQFRNNISWLNLDSDLTELFHTDIPRLRSGHVGGQFWSCFSFCFTQYKDSVRTALEQMDVIKRFVADYNDLEFVTTANGLEQAMKDGKIASMIGVEGGHMIDSSLSVLRMLYELGGRYMTLTHSCHTPWADTVTVNATHNGLTEFGEKIVLEMNRLGMMVDLSHVSPDVMRDAIKLSKAPVIFSHSSVYDICSNGRNVPLDVIKSLPDNGGVIMINFYNDYITCSENATLADVAEHFDYLKTTIGVDFIAMGSDFDGVTRLPDDLTDVSMYPNLIAELLSRGWTKEEIGKIANGNILRVFKAVEKVAAEIKATVGPDESLIPKEEDVKANTTCRSDDY